MPRLTPVCLVTFTARTYDPIAHLSDEYDPTPADLVTLQRDAHAPDLPGPDEVRTLGDLAAWMQEQELRPLARPQLRGNGKIGHAWAGRYALILAKESPTC